MCLGGEVFQEQGIHRSFKADMKLGDFPFGQGDDLHTGKAQMLKEFAKAHKRQDIKVVDTEAKNVIDRTLATNNQELNRLLWKAAGYDRPPAVSEMITELGLYDYRLSELKV